MAQKIALAQQQYQKEVDLMASKSRFGFFSLLPSHTAAITDYAQKTAHKDENGKVKNEVRGLYSGYKSHKVLTKTCFSQVVSPFVGCPYMDPGKVQRQRLLKEKKKWQDKQTFVPARLEKSLISSSYEYKCIKPEDKIKKCRDDQGRVITNPPNICSNPLQKIQHQREKEFKYTEDPYDNFKKKKKLILDEDLAKRGEAFKAGNPVKEFFNNNRKLFDDTSNLETNDEANKKKKKGDKCKNSFIKHQFSFRPSSGYFTKHNGLFNRITYKEQRQQKDRPKTADKAINPKQTFKSMNKPSSARPCPSVALNKMNLMRAMR